MKQLDFWKAEMSLPMALRLVSGPSGASAMPSATMAIRHASGPVLVPKWSSSANRALARHKPVAKPNYTGPAGDPGAESAPRTAVSCSAVQNCSGDVQGRVLRCQTAQLSLVDPDNCQVGSFKAEKRTCNSIEVCPVVCNNPAICGPVPGGWGQWDRWSSCLITCGPGLRVRKRRCDNPAPRNGGADCGNHTLDFSVCLRFGECPVDGAWSLWSPCAHDPGCNSSPRDRCQPGVRLLCRFCNDPAASMGGTSCPTGDARKYMVCWNVDACNNSVLQPPMNFTVVGSPDSLRLAVRWRRAPYGRPATTFYLAWAVDDGSRAGDVFVPVSGQQTLGESYGHRINAEFLANSTVNFGIESWSEADGGVSERLKLSFRMSHVDGVWGPWGDYDSCSPTPDCNIAGRRRRSRRCDSPPPSNGGLQCPGLDIDSGRCYHKCRR